MNDYNQLNISSDMLGQFPEKFFQDQYNRRDRLNQRNNEALRAYNFLSVPGDGSAKAKAIVHDGDVRSGVDTAADILSAMITPDLNYLQTKEINVHPNLNMDAVQTTLFDLINTKNHAPDRLWCVFRDALVSFGCLTKVYIKEGATNIMTGKRERFPYFCSFDFDDWVTDKYDDDASFCVRSSETAASLRANKYYDPRVVQDLIESKSYGSKSNSILQEMNQTLAGDETSPSAGHQFTVYEFVGSATLNDGTELDNVLVTACAGKLLQAVPNPMVDGISPFVLFGNHPAADGSGYPQSLGYDLSVFERRLNMLLSYNDVSVAYNVCPAVQLDDRYLASPYRDMYKLEPHAKFPIKSGYLPITVLSLPGDHNAAFQEIQYLRQRIDTWSGVTTALQGGQTPGNMTATEALQLQQGANTRIASMVRRFQSCATELFRKLTLLWKSEIMTNPDEFSKLLVHPELASSDMAELKQSIFDIEADGLTESRISNARQQDFMKNLQMFLEIPEFKTKIDYDKLYDRFWALTPAGSSFGEAIKAAPLPPPAPPAPPPGVLPLNPQPPQMTPLPNQLAPVPPPGPAQVQ